MELHRDLSISYRSVYWSAVSRKSYTFSASSFLTPGDPSTVIPGSLNPAPALPGSRPQIVYLREELLDYRASFPSMDPTRRYLYNGSYCDNSIILLAQTPQAVNYRQNHMSRIIPNSTTSPQTIKLLKQSCL